MSASETLIKSVVATAEVMGTELSVDAARLMCDELSAYPEPMVGGALARCRRELRTRLTLADILARLDDGRPGPNEAWAMIPLDEETSAVLSDEMAAAMGVAKALIECGDKVAARMAFIEVYQREITKARDERRPVRWFASLGHDVHGREQVLREAVEKGRLTQQHAQRLLPDFAFDSCRPALTSGSAQHISQLLPVLKNPGEAA